jgi:hypothetical protein
MWTTIKIVCAAMLCVAAYGESINLGGDASGTFYNDAGTINYGTTVGQLSYTGNKFGPQSSDQDLDLGKFKLGSSCILCLGTDYNPFAFQLHIEFYVPAGTNSLVYSGNVKGWTWWVLGGAKIDFSNSPIQISYNNAQGSGSFNLTISDAVIGVDDTVTLKGKVTPGAVAVDESAVEPLAIFSIAFGCLAYLVRTRKYQPAL